ncbi:hypothetical protein ACQHIH_16170 [Xanthomonas sontii]|uniref:hypothetical protein n=1 Tax=Xanthomonas sontii TaxID=2650745 RepID=UPI003D5135E7
MTYPNPSGALTKRELIAAMAMQGWISAAPMLNGDNARGTFEHGSRIAIAAVNYADALLAELDKEYPA